MHLYDHTDLYLGIPQSRIAVDFSANKTANKKISWLFILL